LTNHTPANIIPSEFGPAGFFPLVDHYPVSEF
jgi:hypothetical protein